jgi:hypothetical protein
MVTVGQVPPRPAIQWHGYATQLSNGLRQKQSPKSMTWGLSMERMTGIAPAL